MRVTVARNWTATVNLKLFQGLMLLHFLILSEM